MGRSGSTKLMQVSTLGSESLPIFTTGRSMAGSTVVSMLRSKMHKRTHSGGAEVQDLVVREGDSLPLVMQ